VLRRYTVSAPTGDAFALTVAAAASYADATVYIAGATAAGVVTVLPGSWFQRPRPYVRRRAHPLFNFSCLGLN
jgi:hypothetical protein